MGLSYVYAPPMLVWLAQEDIILCSLSQGTWQFTAAAVFSKPKATLQSPWCWHTFSFLYNTFFPKLTVFCFPLLWGVLIGHAALDGFTGKSRHWQTPFSRVMSPREARWFSGFALEANRIRMARLDWQRICRRWCRGAGWGGQFCAQKEAATEGV